MSENFVQILGSSSATPTSDRHPSAQYVCINGNHVLIDCGEGTQMQLIRYGLKSNKIRTILISHLHGDHYFGLVGLLSTMALQGRTQGLRIIGPEPLWNILETQLKQGGNDIPFEIEFISNKADGEELMIDSPSIQLFTHPLNHRVPCWGYKLKTKHTKRKLNIEACKLHQVPIEYYDRIKDGADFHKKNGDTIPNQELSFPPKEPVSYSYISDTCYEENLIPFISKTDLLYHEATFLDELKDRANATYHTTAKEAGILATKALVKKLIIGHFSARYHNLEPLLKETQTEFKNSQLAIEGEKFYF